MERVLYGTNAAGEYVLTGTAGLGSFFSSVGATNQSATINAVWETVIGSALEGGTYFKELAGYPSPADSESPVRFRYAPMYLYKRTDMPDNLKVFFALAFSGEEHRERSTAYSETFVFEKEEMDRAKVGGDGTGHSYLDLLFGVREMNWIDLKQVRQGKRNGSAPVVIDSVSGDIKSEDLLVAVRAAAALLERKRAVVIRVEKEHSFNQRARELLKEIYSLLPPYLAAERGFAAYVSSAQIDHLMNRTSIRTFILPSGESYVAPQCDALYLDLNDPEAVGGKLEDEKQRCMRQWAGLSWDRRLESMEVLFSGLEAGYNDEQQFLEKSKSFFNDPFFAWLQSKDKRNLTTLSEIRALYDGFQPAKTMVWARRMFSSKIQTLLAPKITLDKLTGQAQGEMEAARITRNEAAFTKAREDFSFGQSLGGAENVIGMGNAVSQAIYKVSGDAYKAELDKKDKEISEKEIEIQELTRRHEEKVKQINDDHFAETKRLKECYEAEKKTIKNENEERIRKLTLEHETETKALKETHLTEVKERDSKIEELCRTHSAEVDSLKKKHEADVRAVRQQLETEYKPKLDKAVEVARQEERNRAEARVKKAEKEKAEAENAKQKVATEVQRLQEEVRKHAGPRWHMLLAGILIGALVVGMAWFAVYLFGDHEVTSIAPPVETMEVTPTPEPTPTPTPTPAPSGFEWLRDRFGEILSEDNASDLEQRLTGYDPEEGLSLVGVYSFADENNQPYKENFVVLLREDTTYEEEDADSLTGLEEINDSFQNYSIESPDEDDTVADEDQDTYFAYEDSEAQMESDEFTQQVPEEENDVAEPADEEAAEIGAVGEPEEEEPVVMYNMSEAPVLMLMDEEYRVYAYGNASAANLGMKVYAAVHGVDEDGFVNAMNEVYSLIPKWESAGTLPDGIMDDLSGQNVAVVRVKDLAPTIQVLRFPENIIAKSTLISLQDLGIQAWQCGRYVMFAFLED